MSEQADIIKKVETFIQQMRDLDYVVESGDNNRDARDLGTAMTLFEMSINELKSNRIPYAMFCLMYIDRALATGIIKPGHGLVNKFKECSEINNQLKQDNEKLSNDYFELKEKYEQLVQYLEEHSIKVDYS